MSTIHELEQAVRALAPQDLAAFRAWFAAFDAAAGRLDRFAEEALRDLAEGRCRDL